MSLLSLGYVSREMLLPDIGLIHGRMIVTAWDYGLEDVEDDAIRLLLLAVEVWLPVYYYVYLNHALLFGLVAGWLSGQSC